MVARRSGILQVSPAADARPFQARHRMSRSAQPSFAALRHAGFRRYFACNATAMLADNCEHVVTYWVMYQIFHSPALAGFAVLGGTGCPTSPSPASPARLPTTSIHAA